MEHNGYPRLPTVSRYVASKNFSTAQSNSDSQGRTNSAFSGLYDEGADSFYKGVPFNSLHNGNYGNNGNSGSYTVTRMNVASSGTADEEINAKQRSKCCSCTRSCLIIGLVVGAIALILIIVALVVGLLLGKLDLSCFYNTLYTTYLLMGHPFMTSTRKGGVGLRWTLVNGDVGSAPCGRPQKNWGPLMSSCLFSCKEVCFLYQNFVFGCNKR